MSILGRALADFLGTHSGVVAAYLPAGVPTAIPEALVVAANERRPAQPPFAILIGSKDDSTWPERPVVTASNAIAYRKNDRLVVVGGGHVDIASFSGVYREVMSVDFPTRKSEMDTAALLALAEHAVAQLVAGASIPAPSDSHHVALRLANAWTHLAVAYRQLGQGTSSWNSYWFTHVDLGLSRLLEALIERRDSGSHASSDDAFAELTFAAFSLPRPAKGVDFQVGRRVADALLAHWGDQTAIEATSQQLRFHPSNATAGKPHPLEAVDWTELGRELAGRGNALSAWAHAGKTREGKVPVSAFAQLAEDAFFEPHAGAPTSVIEVVAEDGGSRSLLTVPGGPRFVAVTWDPAAGILVSESLSMRVPLLDLPAPDAVAASGLTLQGRGATWVGNLRLTEGEVWLDGVVKLNLSKTAPRVPARPVRLDAHLPDGDPLVPYVSHSSTPPLYLVCEGTSGAVWFEHKKAGGLKAGSYSGHSDLSTAADDAPETFLNTVTEGASITVVVWCASGDLPGRIAEVEVVPLEAPGMAETTFIAAGHESVSLGATTHEWQAPPTPSSFQSPLLAAIDRSRVTPGQPGQATMRSVRGLIESYLAENISTQNVSASMGHVAVLDSKPALDGLVLNENGTLLTSKEMVDRWHSATDFEVPLEVAGSSEAAEFRDAFKGLELERFLVEPTVDGGEGYRWPSKTAWRHLWADRTTLERYLVAYRALISRAREVGNASGLFWAAYPFSVSVWEENAGQGASAVLLSPLHPIRLSWLASAESALWESEEADFLAGIVEGWNLPLLGPQAFAGGRMIAVPIDNGDGQIFAGWSMLVSASVAGAAPLRPPAVVASLPAPGTAASGLNASAVNAALRTYRRINPHVTSLSIDLAAGAPTPRLDEIDQAVLTAIGEWRSETAVTRGGAVRVQDSLNRLGEIPRAALERILLEQEGLPVMWTRYEHAASASPSSNLRFLQDAGLGVVVAPGSSPNRGLLGEVPVRRFEGPAEVGPWQNASVSSPCVDGELGWSPFTRALWALEDGDAHPQVSIQVFQAQMVSASAEWTVCGESMISPSAMAKLLASGAAVKQMLWEWRPPYLEPSGSLQLERRPFMSVVRVPEAFKSQVSDLLAKADPDGAGAIDADELLGALGARGVGLSSLMAMGGTHAAGALGFYLAFRLMDHVEESDAQYLVLPIDACDSFLRSLAGVSDKHDSLRRADLLVLRLSHGRVTLVPVEIKFYGFQAAAPAPTLPSPGSSSLDEPMDQLAHTQKMLAALVSRYERMHGSSPESWKGLWLQGLVTLLESASRLQPASGNAALINEVLQETLRGETVLDVGRPLLCYFGHQAKTSSGRAFEGFTRAVHGNQVEMGEAGGIICNTAAAFEAAANPEGPLVSRWREVLSWAAEAEGAAPRPPIGGNDGPTISAPPVPGDEPNDQTDGDEDERPIEPRPPLRPDGDQENDSGDFIAGDGVRFPVGRSLTSLSGHEVEFWPSNTRLNQMNLGVVGDLGTGKTQLLKALTYQLRAECERTQPTPLSMLIFDYKRDFQDSAFLDRVGGEVLAPFHIPLNVFALKEYTNLSAWQSASRFLDVLSKIYSGIGPVQGNRLKTVILDLYKANQGTPPTLADVLDAYRAAAGTEDAVTGILSTFVMGEIFTDEPSKLVPFDELLNDGVLVVALSDLGADQQLKNALVVLFLNQYYEYMLSRPKWPFQGEDPQLRRLNSMLLVDEATNIMKYEFPVLMDLMLQGREFGVGVTLASQYLSHFKVASTNYGQPLLTWFIHKVPNVTARELRMLGLVNATDAMAERISTLGVHEALCSTLDVPGEFIRGTPFYKLLHD